MPSQCIHTSKSQVECETPLYLSLKRNLAEARGSSQRRSVWSHMNEKYLSKYCKHTHAQAQRLEGGQRCQTVVSIEACVVWMFAFVRWVMRSSLFHENPGCLNGQRACEADECQVDIMSHLTPYSSSTLCPTLLIITLRRYRRALPAGPQKHPGMYQFLLKWLSQCQIPH